jgi:hypothetical protein
MASYVLTCRKNPNKQTKGDLNSRIGYKCDFIVHGNINALYDEKKRLLS